MKPHAHWAKIADKRLPVLVVQEKRRARIATRHDVIERAFELDAKRAGHAFRIAGSSCKRNIQDLILL